MSVSMYSGQVNRLTSELASLRSKLADERRKLADANAKSLKAADALSRARTTSQLSSKARELERHQKAAAGHEKKSADVEKAIAQKQKSLTSAQGSLDSAQRDQQKKDDREVEKRRKADLDHIRRLERERRATTMLPEQLVARPRVITTSTDAAPMSEFTDTYDVCLSFAGEQRDYVELIATELKGAGLDVFYDEDEDIAPKLWGRDLGEYLDYVYRKGSRFLSHVISADYAKKAWTTHERRSALARVIKEGGDSSCRRASTTPSCPVCGRPRATSTCRQIAPQTLVEFVLKKLGKSS